MNDRFKFRIWNGSEMHYNDFVVTATGYVGKITEEFLDKCVFNQEDLTADKECTLMQCTGLKDKNGKLIYEGDIVKCSYGFNYYIGTVVWDSEYIQFSIEVEKELYSFNQRSKNDLIEAIGNIYENPEALN